MVSYNKLWKLLIDRGMKKTDLQTIAGISSVSLAKLGKNENVNTDTLNKICDALQCDFSDIMERITNSSEDTERMPLFHQEEFPRQDDTDRDPGQR